MMAERKQSSAGAAKSWFTDVAPAPALSPSSKKQLRKIIGLLASELSPTPGCSCFQVNSGKRNDFDLQQNSLHLAISDIEKALLQHGKQCRFRQELHCHLRWVKQAARCKPRRVPFTPTQARLGIINFIATHWPLIEQTEAMNTKALKRVRKWLAVQQQEQARQSLCRPKRTSSNLLPVLLMLFVVICTVAHKLRASCRELELQTKAISNGDGNTAKRSNGENDFSWSLLIPDGSPLVSILNRTIAHRAFGNTCPYATVISNKQLRKSGDRFGMKLLHVEFAMSTLSFGIVCANGLLRKENAQIGRDRGTIGILLSGVHPRQGVIGCRSCVAVSVDGQPKFRQPVFSLKINDRIDFVLKSGGRYGFVLMIKRGLETLDIVPIPPSFSLPFTPCATLSECSALAIVGDERP